MTRKEHAGEIDRNAGARLRNIRNAAGVSQEELGEAIGVSFQQVQKYEKGSNRIAISTLVVICKKLGCNPLDIIGGDFARSGKVFDTLMSRNAALEQRLSQIGNLAKHSAGAREARQ